MGGATRRDQNGGETRHRPADLFVVSTSLKCFIVFQMRASQPLDLKDTSQPKVDISDVD